MEKIIRRVYKDKVIEDLWTNYFCVSSNLTSADMQIHRSGLLSEALLATTALPGICAPVIHENSLLVDGSILNNMHCDVMRRLGAGRVIAVDVSSDEDLSVDYDRVPTGWQMLYRKILRKKNKGAVPDILDILMRSTVLYSVHKMEQSRKDADLYIRPPVENVGLLEFEGLEKLAETGYKHAAPIARQWLEEEFDAES
jgi:predicted acylesterase/phospholipase RssA